MGWAQVALPRLSGQQVCVDGKTLRGSRVGDQAVHLLSAYAAQARLVLAQQAVGEKTNEIMVIPDLLSLEAIRGHRAIENSQHWVLDVPFGEDNHRARRRRHSAENLAVVRRTALNVIRHNGPSKDSLRRRKLRASLNDDYRAQLIFGPQTT